METKCAAKNADRSPCRYPAAGWWVITDKTRLMVSVLSGRFLDVLPVEVSPLCGVHANQRERAGAEMTKVIAYDGQVVGEARA